MSHAVELPPDESRGVFAWFAQNHVAASLAGALRSWSPAPPRSLTGPRAPRGVMPGDHAEHRQGRAGGRIRVRRPSEVEQSICVPDHRGSRRQGVTGVDKVTSTVGRGRGRPSSIETLQDADVDRVLDDVKNQRQTRSPTFPERDRRTDRRAPGARVKRGHQRCPISGDVGELALIKRLAEQTRDRPVEICRRSPRSSSSAVRDVRDLGGGQSRSGAAADYGITFDDRRQRDPQQQPRPARRRRSRRRRAGQTLLRIAGAGLPQGGEFEDSVTVLTSADGQRGAASATSPSVTRRFRRPGPRWRASTVVPTLSMLKVYRVGDQDAIVPHAKRSSDWVRGGRPRAADAGRRRR